MFPEWMSKGACVGQPSDIFFPEYTENAGPARQICKGCNVRAECLAYAMENRIEYGVWGSLSPKERSRLRRKRRAA